MPEIDIIFEPKMAERRMVKVYTKTGDSGITSLFGGERTNKDSIRIMAHGDVDELNSLIGLILADDPKREISKKLLRVQAELFVLGSDLATPPYVKTKVPRIRKSHINRLEREIDQWDEKLPQLKNFILPGGSKVGAGLHLARSVARRTERVIVALSQHEKINVNDLAYINRLSDWLFVAARYINHLEKIPEIIWKGRK